VPSGTIVGAPLMKRVQKGTLKGGAIWHHYRHPTHEMVQKGTPNGGAIQHHFWHPNHEEGTKGTLTGGAFWHHSWHPIHEEGAKSYKHKKSYIQKNHFSLIMKGQLHFQSQFQLGVCLTAPWRKMIVRHSVIYTKFKFSYQYKFVL
jgi:hypothetical protein